MKLKNFMFRLHIPEENVSCHALGLECVSHSRVNRLKQLCHDEGAFDSFHDSLALG